MAKVKNEKLCLKSFLKKKYQNNGISEIKEEKVKADKMKETDFITFPGLYGYTVSDFSDIKKNRNILSN